MDEVRPRKTSLWRGAILGGIITAIKSAENRFFATCCGWAEDSYALNGGDGRQGVVIFQEGNHSDRGILVGVFFDPNGPRWRGRESDHVDLDKLFQGCPAPQRRLAELIALPFLEYQPLGPGVYLATAVFWDDGEFLAASDPWDLLLRNGGSLLTKELIEDLDAALTEWNNDCQLSPNQVELALLLFKQKTAKPERPITLTRAQVDFLRSTFRDPKETYRELAALDARFRHPPDPTAPPEPPWWESIDSGAEARKALETCRKQFASIGILFPTDESAS